MATTSRQIASQRNGWRGAAAFLLFGLAIWFLATQLAWEPWVGWSLAAAVGIILRLDDGQPTA